MNTSLYRYLLLISLVLLLALTGYSSFILYSQLAAGSGLVLLAKAAGLASLFSPCSFPLLVTLLARKASAESKAALMRMAGAFTLGVMAFLILLGVALAIGAGAFVSQFTFTSIAGRILRIIVGLILISFGLWQIRGQSLNVGWLTQLLQPLWHAQTRWQRQKTTVGYSLYGFGYILAGFG
jgi:cytochrome c biogenesis protein CcdA